MPGMYQIYGGAGDELVAVLDSLAADCVGL